MPCSYCLLRAGFFVCLEDRGEMFLRNAGRLSADHRAEVPMTSGVRTSSAVDVVCMHYAKGEQLTSPRHVATEDKGLMR
jgi:hypothetical protein